MATRCASEFSVSIYSFEFNNSNDGNLNACTACLLFQCLFSATFAVAPMRYYAEQHWRIRFINILRCFMDLRHYHIMTTFHNSIEMINDVSHAEKAKHEFLNCFAHPNPYLHATRECHQSLVWRQVLSTYTMLCPLLYTKCQTCASGLDLMGTCKQMRAFWASYVSELPIWWWGNKGRLYRANLISNINKRIGDMKLCIWIQGGTLFPAVWAPWHHTQWSIKAE